MPHKVSGTLRSHGGRADVTAPQSSCPQHSLHCITALRLTVASVSVSMPVVVGNLCHSGDAQLLQLIDRPDRSTA